jgi:hypothetical protein
MHMLNSILKKQGNFYWTGKTWVPVYLIHLLFLDGDQLAADSDSQILHDPFHADPLALLFLASPSKM